MWPASQLTSRPLPPVLVATVPNHAVEITRIPEDCLNLLPVPIIEGELKGPGIVFTMIRYTQSGPDDHPGYCWTIQGGPHGDVADAHAKSCWNKSQPPQAPIICAYFDRLAVFNALPVGCGCPRYFSDSKPPQRVPYVSRWMPESSQYSTI
jgi:hypothetical protein